MITNNELDSEYDPGEHIDRLLYEGQVLMDALNVFADRDNWVQDEEGPECPWLFTMNWPSGTPWGFAQDMIDSLKVADTAVDE